MTFLNPLVLLGLIAAGIPLLIHLFNFRRPRKVDFSSLVFLKELQQTTMQRVRIKQWLLLALRTAAIACLVLSFARPTLEGSIAGSLGGDAESASVVVIDNSMSMTVRGRDGMLIDEVRGMGLELVDLMRSGDQVAVIKTAGDAVRADPAWLKTRGAVREELSSIAPAFGEGTLVKMIRRASDLLQESSMVNREIFVLSDFQASTFGETDGQPLADGVPVRLLHVGGSVSSNVSVLGVEVVSRIVERGQPVKLRAAIGAYGSDRLPPTIASVFLNNERVAQATVEPDPESTVLVDFAITPRASGWLSGEVRIEDDDFEVDNSRYFTLYVPDERKVLLVRGPDFRSDYLELALSSRLAPGRTRFDLTVISADRLSSAALARFDVILIAGVDRFSSGEIALVSTYVDEGGGLLLFPPVGVLGGNFDDLLDTLAGGRLRGFVGGSSEPVAEIESVDVDHPLFEGVFDASSGGTDRRIEQTEVFRYADYEPVRASELTLMRLSSGRPFLQEMRPGVGRALFMTSLPDPAWSALPVRGLFVPLLFRALHYLSSGDAVSGGEVILGESGEIRVPAADAGTSVSVRTTDTDFVPEQRSVFGGTLVTIGPELTAPGVADLVVGETVARRVSVNANAREFDLRYVGVDDAVDALGGGEAGVEALLPGREPGSLASEVQTLRTGVELWNVFLTLALVFLIVEMLVARHWNPEAVVD